MIPSRKSYQSADETNLQQQHNSPLVNPNPLPPYRADVGENPPPTVPRRNPTPAYQPSLPTSLYGYGMNPYNMNQNFGYNGFMSGYTNPMMAGTSPDSVFHGVESVSRSAFESVGSVVQTLSSCSMMLQSTLFAIQNSVHAVTNVAQQFTNLRSYLIENCISLMRIIKYYLRRLSYLLMLQGTSKDITSSTVNLLPSEQRSGQHILLFFAVVIGTPYLLWRFMKSILSHSESGNDWKRGMGEHFVGEVKYTYNAINKDELSITQGDLINIAPKHKQPVIKGWILASKKNEHGLVPANYIKILSKSCDNNVSTVRQKTQEVEEIEEGNN